MWFLDKKIYQLDFLQQQVMHHCMATSSLKANIYCPKTDFLPPGKCKLWEDSSERRFIINLHTDLPINFYRLHRLVIRGVFWSIWDFLRPFHQNLRPESKATEMWSHFFVLGILENSRSDATNVVFSGSESNYDYFTISRFSGKIDHQRGGLGWVKGNLRTQWPIKSGADGNAALLHIFRHHVQTKRQGPKL